MGLEHVNFINSDLTWGAVKKGHRSMIRRPTKPGTSSFRFGVNLGEKMPDSVVFEYEKSGVAVLGQHFAEKALDVPKKKRFLHQSSPPRTQGTMSSQPQTPSPHHEDPRQLKGRKHASGQLSRSNSLSKSQEPKLRNGLSNNEFFKLTKKEVTDLYDFSGIELLAAAACISSIYDTFDHVEESSVLEEHTTPGVDSGEKANIASDGSSVQDSVTQNHQENVNDGEDKGLVVSKGVRLLWDLNTAMNEWEDACYDIQVDPCSQNIFSDGVCNDGLQSAQLNLGGYESRNSEVTEGEQGCMLHGICANQSPLNSQSTVVTQDRVDCKTSSAKLGSLLTESNQPGKHDTAISIPPLVKQEIVSLQGDNGDRFKKTYVLNDYRTSSTEVMHSITGKTSDAESCLSKSDAVCSFIRPANCGNLSTSTTSVSQGQTNVKDQLDTTHDFPVCFVASNIMPKTDDGQPVPEVVKDQCQALRLSKSDCHNKLTSEDHLNDCWGSDVSQDEQGHMAEGNTLDKTQAGYDSPFEDGELREPIGYTWQKNEVEEREYMQYDSNNISEDDCDIIKYPISGKNEVTHDDGETMGDGRYLLERDVQEKFTVGNSALAAVPNNDIEREAEADGFKKPTYSLGFKASGYQLKEHSENVILEDNDGSAVKFLAERKRGHNESRIRGNLLYVDGSTSFDVRRNGAYIRRRRSGNIGDSYSRVKRDFGPEKFMRRDRLCYQNRGRNDVQSQQVASSMGKWDSRKSHGYARPKNVIGDSAVRSSGSSSLDNNQTRNYNPRGSQMTGNRRPSPFDRNDFYGNRRGTPPARGPSHDRCRDASGFRLQGLKRALREEKHYPEPCYLERKVRCFSQTFDRGAHLSRPRRRSRSGSRSESPIAWHFMKRGNVDTRKQGPEYMPEARFHGERSPFRKPNFGATERSFISPTGGHMSTMHTSKSFDDRDFVDGEYRDRGPSQVRMFRQNRRFESNGYPGRLKSDDHFQPAPRPGKFLQMTFPNSEHKYEDNGTKYTTIRLRHYDDGGGGRQFKHAVGDSFETHNP